MDGPTSNLVTPLLTDLYQITMAYGYWKSNRHETPATFELFFRKNPFKGSYTVFCGLDEVLKFIKTFKFSSDEIEYLKTVPALKHCEDEFFAYLSKLDCKDITVDAIPQGSIVFPRVPLIVISGPMIVGQLIETTLLNLVNFPSLVATNASRMVIAARGQDGSIRIEGKVPVLAEFGVRRAQGPDGAFSASKYCMVGGFDAVANVQAGKYCNIPIVGTQAHSFIMSFSSLDEVKGSMIKRKGSDGKQVDLLQLVKEYRTKTGFTNTNDGELAAFISYAVAFPDSCLCLIDTYGTIESGLKNYIVLALALNDCGYKAVGVRLDSGDLGELSKQCHVMLKEAAKKFKCDNLKDQSVVASNDINEKVLYELNRQKHGITTFGIGTNLVTCQAQPALGCVYKLVESNGEARIKLSQEFEKVLIPGQKRAYRLFENGKPLMDFMTKRGEVAPKAGKSVKVVKLFDKSDVKSITPSRVEELTVTMWNGKMVTEIPDLMESRKRCVDTIKTLPSGLVGEKSTMQYEVRISEDLSSDLHKLWESRRMK